MVTGELDDGIKRDEPKEINTNSGGRFKYPPRRRDADELAVRTLEAGLLIDEALQHHHEAPRLLAQRAVRVLLQEGEQLLSDLGQDGGHVVLGQRVGAVQVHHRVLQVAAQRDRSAQTGGGGAAATAPLLT